MPTAALPTSVTPLAIPRVLYAFEFPEADGNSRLVVSKTPQLPVSHAMTDPIRVRILGRCLTVRSKKETQNPDFLLGLQQSFTLGIHQECPSTEHYCQATAEDVTRILTI